MPIEFQCNICGAKLRTPDGSAGKKTKCPKCEYVLSIPEASDASQPYGAQHVPDQQPPASRTPLPPQQVPPPSPSPPSPSPSAFDHFDDDQGAEAWSSYENSGTQDFGGQDFDAYDFGESGNPYQAPADYGPMPTSFRSDGIFGDKLDFSQAFHLSFQALKQNFLGFFVLGIFATLLFGCFSGVSVVLQSAARNDPSLRIHNSSFSLFQNFVTSYTGVAFSFCALELIRRGRTSVNSWLVIVKKFFSLLLCFILQGLISVAVVAIPAIALILIAVAMRGAIGGFSLLLLFSALIWMFASTIALIYRIGWSGLLIVDQDVPALESISLSWKISQGNTLTLIAIFLIFGLGALAALLVTLLVGVLVVVPFGLCLFSMCYHIMWEQYKRRTAHDSASEW